METWQGDFGDEGRSVQTIDPLAGPPARPPGWEGAEPQAEPGGPAAAPQAASQQDDWAARVYRPPARPLEQNLARSAIGAALGAGLGGLIWYGIGYVLGVEIGYVAVLVGALSGWGAVWIGKARSEAVGCVAAVIGLAGIFGGSYALYHTGCWYDTAKAEMRQDFYHTRATMDGGWDARSDAEKEALFEAAYQAALDAAPGYFAAIASEPVDLMIMIVFGVLGLYYGFRVGAGLGSGGSQL